LEKHRVRIDGAAAVVSTGNDKGTRLGVSLETASAAFEIASWALLVAFIVGGMAAIVIVFTSSDSEHQWSSLREQSRARIVELESEAATASAALRSAETDTAAAREVAATANVRAADAERRAAEASLETEKNKNPRTLSPQQLARMTERLRRFEKTPFDFSLVPESEAISLMDEIARALTHAGWEWNGLPLLLVSKHPGEPPRTDTSSGVQIQIDERRKQEWEKPALELRDALKSAGLEATAEAIKAYGAGDNAIHIRIGRAR
jgi:hypothetical protein